MARDRTAVGESIPRVTGANSLTPGSDRGPATREAAFANLKAPLLLAPAPADPMDASEAREASDR